MGYLRSLSQDALGRIFCKCIFLNLLDLLYPTSGFSHGSDQKTNFRSVGVCPPPYLEVGPYLWSIRVSSVRIWQWVVVVLGQHEVRKHPLPRFRVCVLAQLNQGLVLVLTQPNGWQLGQLGEGYLKTKSEQEVAVKSGISWVTTARLKNLYQVLVVLQEGIE